MIISTADGLCMHTNAINMIGANLTLSDLLRFVNIDETDPTALLGL